MPGSVVVLELLVLVRTEFSGVAHPSAIAAPKRQKIRKRFLI